MRNMDAAAFASKQESLESQIKTLKEILEPAIGMSKSDRHE